MFSLDQAALSGTILGCADGPASFNAEAHRLGLSVTSIDPIYAFDRFSIARRIAEVSEDLMRQVYENLDEYVWDIIKNPKHLYQTRQSAMEVFLSDFEAGKEDGRYIAAAAPKLPFKDEEFDLALCSHFLFLYSNQFGYDQHLESVQSLIRVAKEVRIFPILSMPDNTTSIHLMPIIDELRMDGFNVSIESVDYEFMRGASEMLLISKI